MMRMIHWVKLDRGGGGGVNSKSWAREKRESKKRTECTLGGLTLVLPVHKNIMFEPLSLLHFCKKFAPICGDRNITTYHFV